MCKYTYKHKHAEIFLTNSQVRIKLEKKVKQFLGIGFCLYGGYLRKFRYTLSIYYSYIDGPYLSHHSYFIQEYLELTVERSSITGAQV